MSVVEPAAGGGGPNRMFIVLALGLVGLLILATIVLLGIVFIPRIFQGGPTEPSHVLNLKRKMDFNIVRRTRGCQLKTNRKPPGISRNA